MTRTAWLFVFVAVLAFAGIASAEEAPALPSVQPVTVAPLAEALQPVGAAETPAFDLSQIFSSPEVSTVPAPAFKSCTLIQCRSACKIPGCFSSCIDIETCECEAICP